MCMGPHYHRQSINRAHRPIDLFIWGAVKSRSNAVSYSLLVKHSTSSMVSTKLNRVHNKQPLTVATYEKTVSPADVP